MKFLPVFEANYIVIGRGQLPKVEMRYGIVSDVHGNLEALEVVLGHLKKQAVDEYVFLGEMGNRR